MTESDQTEVDAKSTQTERPPVVVVMGHIDHGKSSLLDYIRKSNIVSKEAGGITQHLGAYEIEHKDGDGEMKKITFLDTPGHAAFCGVRIRGTKVADIAILIISAEDGVMPQTLEAYECIRSDHRPFIVAINKIDSPKANVEKVKADLIENGIYIEGSGGDIPAVEISAQDGTNINELLDLILLASQVEDLTADVSVPAEGFVVEAHKDKNKGISATLVIKNGTLRRGDFVSCGDACAPVRIFEDHDNKPIKDATVSKPVHICGWDKFPAVGEVFQTFTDKKEAVEACSNFVLNEVDSGVADIESSEDDFVIPIIVKSDTHGSIEAVEHEMEKVKATNSKVQIVFSGTGNISEGDVKTASGNENSIIVGFGIDVDKQAMIMSERLGISVNTFKVIYDLVNWLEEEIEKKRPRIEVDEVLGKAKVLKIFSSTKSKVVLGGRVLEGKISNGSKIKIMRRGEEIATGKIKELQTQKSNVDEVEEGSEFGTLIETKQEIVPADEIETFKKTTK